MLAGALMVVGASATPAVAIEPAPIPPPVALPTASVQTAAGTSALPIQTFCASTPCLSVTYTLTPPSVPEVAVTTGEVVHFQLGVDPASVLLDFPQPDGGPDRRIPLAAARTTDWSGQSIGTAELVVTSSVGTVSYAVRFVAPTPPPASRLECVSWAMRVGRLGGRIDALASSPAPRALALSRRLTRERAGFLRLLAAGCYPPPPPGPLLPH